MIMTGVSPPSDPPTGSLYYDQNNANTYQWNGRFWVAIASEGELSNGFLILEHDKMVQYMDELGEI